MEKNIMTQFKSEGDPAFSSEENKENDNSSDSSADQTNTDQTQSQEGDQNSGENKKDDGDDKDNFLNHPRWKEREDDWKNRYNEQEKRQEDEITKLREEFDDKIKSVNTEYKKNLPSSIPQWFGGDEQQWSEYCEFHNNLVHQAEENALNKIKSLSSAEQRKIDEATNYFRSTLSDLESETGEKIDQNKLLKFTLDNDLVDSQGRWNYRAAYRLMKSVNVNPNDKNNINEKKKIAEATMKGDGGETKPQPFMTTKDFKNPSNRPW